MKLIAIFFTLFAITAKVESTLRGSHTEEDNIISGVIPFERNLQAARAVCAFISNQIGRVNCECDFDRSSLTLSYSCDLVNPICTPPISLIGQFCATPSYAGEIELNLGARALNKTNTICAANTTATGTVLGDYSFDDLCVSIDSCFGGGNTDPVCGCSATFGGVACESCTPCTTGRGRNGISLQCGIFGSPICLPISVPGLLSRGEKFEPFIPQYFWEIPSNETEAPLAEDPYAEVEEIFEEFEEGEP